MNAPTQREGLIAPANPLGMEGIEFVEYATRRPQALGQVLETMGFHPVARHRSREVLLYRQGDMNVIVNAHLPEPASQSSTDDAPVIAGVTKVRAQHILQLREVVNAIRAVAGWPAFTFTNAIAPGPPIRQLDLLELRAAIATLRENFSRLAIRYADPMIAGGPMKAAHMEELRTLVK